MCIPAQRCDLECKLHQGMNFSVWFTSEVSAPRNCLAHDKQLQIVVEKLIKMGFLLVTNTTKSKKEVCKTGYLPNLAVQGSLAVCREEKEELVRRMTASQPSWLAYLVRASDPEANFFSPFPNDITRSYPPPWNRQCFSFPLQMAGLSFPFITEPPFWVF